MKNEEPNSSTSNDQSAVDQKDGLRKFYWVPVLELTSMMIELRKPINYEKITEYTPRKAPNVYCIVQDKKKD